MTLREKIAEVISRVAFEDYRVRYPSSIEGGPPPPSPLHLAMADAILLLLGTVLWETPDVGVRR